MGVLNYTTQIDTLKTVTEMQQMLGRAGADRISMDYADGRVTAMSFMLATPHGPRHFTLPCDAEAMRRLLVKQEAAGQLRSTKMSRAMKTSPEQAERVAWRVMKDWLAAQLALVETQMAGLDQVMLPYLVIDEGSGRTLYDSYRDREASVKALS